MKSPTNCDSSNWDSLVARARRAAPGPIDARAAVRLRLEAEASPWLELAWLFSRPASKLGLGAALALAACWALLALQAAGGGGAAGVEEEAEGIPDLMEGETEAMETARWGQYL